VLRYYVFAPKIRPRSDPTYLNEVLQLEERTVAAEVGRQLQILVEELFPADEPGELEEVSVVTTDAG
jgi:hypothetical protein